MKLPAPSLLLALVIITAAQAAAPDAATLDPAARLAAARKLADGIKYQKGDIILKGGVAKISIPEDFRYIDPAGTTTVVNELWGNPGHAEHLGMIVPKGFDPLSAGSWGAILTFDEQGYVKDDDAAKINYDDLMKEMKKGAEEASKEREKLGYHSMALIGWAAPPRYDATNHKLYWAKELKFGDSPEHTLNYNIRMLGRRGVLVVNVVAGLRQLKEVEAATPALLAMVNFQDGHRYADFNGDTDKVATYGLAALIAGGVAAKVGLFKGLWIAILAMKKFIIIGVLAVVSYLKKLFGGKKAETTAPGGSLPPPLS